MNDHADGLSKRSNTDRSHRVTTNNRNAQAAEKRHADKTASMILTIRNGIEVFNDRETTKRRIKKEKEDDIVRSKLLPK